jgi:hypothetical protein
MYSVADLSISGGVMEGIGSEASGSVGDVLGACLGMSMGCLESDSSTSVGVAASGSVGDVLGTCLGISMGCPESGSVGDAL